MQFQAAVEAITPASAFAWHFVFIEGKLLLDADGQLVPQPYGQAMPVTAHYLGRWQEQDCWAYTLPQAPEVGQTVSLRAAMLNLPGSLQGLAARAAQIIEWDRAHQFCGGCGSPTVSVPTERAKTCPQCQRVFYPRLSPAMMALVWREGEILLARSPSFTPGIYSALAGFVEAGESVEACVAREVAEEVGLRVTELSYYGSQSWPFPHSLMLAYTAKWEGGQIVPQAGEIEEAAWFPIDALPPIPPRFSISGHLIRDTVAAMQAGGGVLAAPRALFG